MIKKKRYLVLAIIAIAIIAGLVGYLFLNRKEGISRYTWVDMLTAKFNITEYQNKSPYFSDVSSSNDHFVAVQSAYEWAVLDESVTFDGDKKITGEYAVLTAMRAIGAYKIRIYLGISELPTDEQLLELATNEKLVTKSALKKNVSAAEAEEILEKAFQLYKGKLWVDDYYEYEYADNVIEIPSDDIVTYNSDSENLVVSNNVLSVAEVGKVLVFIEPESGMKTSKKIERIDSNGTLYLSDALLEETVKSFVMSDIFGTDEIFSALTSQNTDGYGSTKDSQNSYSITPVIDIPIKSKGVSISVKIEESEATLTITNNDKKIKSKYVFPGEYYKESIIPDVDEYCEFTIELSKLNIGVQTDYNVLNAGGFNYFLTEVDTEFDTTFKAGGCVDAKLPLPPFTLLGSDLGAAIDLQLVLITTIDGQITITAEFPSETILEYRRGAGIRRHTDSDANVEAEICCSIEDKLRFEPLIILFKKKIFDFDIDVGIGAEASVKMRNNSNIKTCIDIRAYAPILSFSYLEDDESLLSEFVQSDTYEIFTSENAPFRKILHYEFYRDGTSKIVPDCTYKSDNNVRLPDIDLSLPHNYYAIFTGDISDAGDHYEVVGSLLEEVYFETEQLRNLSVGGSVSCDGHSFTCTEIIKDEETERYKYMQETNVSGNLDSVLAIKQRYYVFDNGCVAIDDPPKDTYCLTVNGGIKYNYLYSITAEEIKNQVNQRMPGSIRINPIPALMTVDDNYTFWIDKNTCPDAKSIISKGNIYDVSFELDGAPQEMVDQWYSSGLFSWAGVQGINPCNNNFLIVNE